MVCLIGRGPDSGLYIQFQRSGTSIHWITPLTPVLSLPGTYNVNPSTQKSHYMRLHRTRRTTGKSSKYQFFLMLLLNFHFNSRLTSPRISNKPHENPGPDSNHYYWTQVPFYRLLHRQCINYIRPRRVFLFHLLTRLIRFSTVARTSFWISARPELLCIPHHHHRILRTVLELLAFPLTLHNRRSGTFQTFWCLLSPEWPKPSLCFFS